MAIEDSTVLEGTVWSFHYLQSQTAVLLSRGLIPLGKTDVKRHCLPYLGIFLPSRAHPEHLIL